MKIVFMGTPAAAVPSLERIVNDGHSVAAVYTQPDRPSGRGNKITFSPVKEFALRHGLSVHQPSKVKTQEALNEFTSHKADAAVVVAYGRILPQGFLDAFQYGAINVHFSLLPKYRGAAPVNWAIVNGETLSGVTTMQMDAGLDTGSILLTSETDIGRFETAVELMDRLSFIGADLISETLAKYRGIVTQPQNDEDATLAPMMKREDGQIDWELTAIEIANRIRGFQPFPGSFTGFRGQKLSIWRGFADFELLSPAGSKPGQIVSADNHLNIFCGKNTILRITEVQMEGKRRMPVRDFLNGFKPEAGETLG